MITKYKDFLFESVNTLKTIKTLQEELYKIDDWFGNSNRIRPSDEQRAEKNTEGRKIREKLYQMTGDSYGNVENTYSSIKQIKDDLGKYKNPKIGFLRKDGSVSYDETWEEIIEGVIRMRTGGYTDKQINDFHRNNYKVYGSVKPISSSAQLNKDYDYPQDVPKSVYQYIFKNGSILNDNASDAVRWSRIINTKDDDRYPRGEITIYRAVEPQYSNSEIREGDWVTTDESYAINHNERYFNGKGTILSMDVDGRDVLVSPTGNYEEAIYAPLKYSIDIKL